MFLASTLFWASAMPAQAAVNVIEWTRQFGTSKDDEARGVAVQPNGSVVYAVGSTEGDFSGASGSNVKDGFLRCYSSAGAAVWTRQVQSLLAGKTDDVDWAVLNAAATSSDGAIRAAGTAHVRGWPMLKWQGLALSLSSAGSFNARRWLGATGDWPNYSSEGLCLAAGPQNTACVGGEVTYLYTSGYGSYTMWNSGATRALTQQAWAPGGADWARSIAAPGEAPTYGNGTVKGIARTSDGSVYVGGYLGSSTYSSAFVARYSPQGQLLWRQAIPVGYVDALAASPTGSGVYVAGHLNGTLDGQTSKGWNDAFVTHLGDNGTRFGTFVFGTTGDESVRGLAVDDNTNAYVVGSTSGTFSQQTYAGGYQDIYVAAIRNVGTIAPRSLRWAKQLGTIKRDEATDVEVDSKHNVYVTGFSDAALSGQTSSGLRDAVLMKFRRDTLAPIAAPTPERYSSSRSTNTSFLVTYDYSDPSPSSDVDTVRIEYRDHPSATWRLWRVEDPALEPYIYYIPPSDRFFPGVAGHTYYFRVRPTDKDGNTGAWSSEIPAAVPYDQGVCAFQGSWTTASAPSAYGGSVRWSSTNGAAASYAFTGARELALIVTKHPSGGYAYAYVGGTKVATIDTYSATTRYRVPQLVKTYSAPTSGTLKIVVPRVKNSASSGYTVDVDAVGVLR